MFNEFGRKLSEWRYSIAFAMVGFSATAVTFGPARMGFGLFLPVFRSEFALSTETAGLIASAAFSAFLVALPLSAVLLNRYGPRAPIITGGLLAFFGMGITAAAVNVYMLIAGIVMAGASPGFSWTPYNNAAPKMVAKILQPHVLSAISTGTTFGITGAGILAYLMVFYDFSWRYLWFVFALCALFATIINFRLLRPVAGWSQAYDDDGSYGSYIACLRELVKLKALPLFTLALSFGITSSIYLSFAADMVTNAGGLNINHNSAGAVIFTALGGVGIVGLFAGRLEDLMGLKNLLAAVFVSSAVSFILLGYAPESVWAVLASAGLQGGCIMTISSIFSFWSLRLFPHLPAYGLTGAILAVAAGSVIGPAVAGYSIECVGAQVTFLYAGALSMVTVAGLYVKGLSA